MNISDDKQVDVLLHALTERYSSIHIIRERLQNLGIWTLGILFAASGWLFQSDVYLYAHEQIILLTILVALVFVLFSTYIKDLEQGFKNQLQVAAKIEDELGLYSEDKLTKKPLYPLSWKSAGTEMKEGKYFDTNRTLILTGALVLSLAILSKGCLFF